MNSQIIDPDRYKKTTKKELEKRKKKNKQKYSTKISKKNDLKYNKNKQKQIKSKEIKLNTFDSYNDLSETENLKIKTKKVKKKIIYIPKILKISFVVIAIILIGFLSKQVIKIENMPILSVFSNKEKDVELKSSYNLKLGISKLDTTDVQSSKNIILNELNLHASIRFIDINNDYTINYIAAKKIEKKSNREYLVYLNEEYELTFADIENAINKIRNYGENNPYFKNIDLIERIENNNEYITFYLKEDNPYYIYMLNFPLNIENKNLEYYMNARNDNSINFIKRNSSSTISAIDLTNYQDTDQMVADFRDDKLDMFFTSSDSVIKLIGKHEYNIKKYRDGETVFLFGNTSSRLFQIKELRKALVYSLNREEIVKNTNKSFSEVIDLPFIYSEISYKYDIYGAENEFLSNGWVKKDGIYTKSFENEEIRAELNMIVNDEDTLKKNIALYIKEMAEKIGIKINLQILPKAEYDVKVQNKEYDIILASVFVNEIPDISYLKDYINVNETVFTSLEKVNLSSNAEELAKNINELQNVLSQEVACIGISARNTSVVYQKYITGFDYMNYFKVFTNLNNIGRIKEE